MGRVVSDATGLSIYLPTNGPDDLYTGGKLDLTDELDEMLDVIED